MIDVARALAFARGVPGVMTPVPEEAESDDAIALLKYAAMIQAADEPAALTNSTEPEGTGRTKS